MSRFRADLVLLLVALIWGSAFAVQRVAAQYFDVFTFNGLRFLLGGLVLIPFSGLNPLRYAKKSRQYNRNQKSTPIIPLDRKSFAFMLLGGILLFGAAGLQQAGLETTTAGNAGFITTLYVVLVPILLVIFWKEKIDRLAWLGAFIAIIGSLLLSTGGTLRLALGDALVMAGSVLWALHLILVSRAVHHMDLLTFAAGQYIIAGTINLLVNSNVPAFELGSGWWTIFYIGLLSTAVGYTLQGLGQKYSPPTDATILLSMEAVFAASFGAIFLGESMQPVQLVGCGLILGAVILTQIHSLRAYSPVIKE
ncbi:MAG: EamA family transporter [Anaerolineales bacterium]|nr:DMT family transporter [Anaerolineae bacterium]PWB52197.1 MAG: EamA family transporter [Anaerolineales bacterium]